MNTKKFLNEKGQNNNQLLEEWQKLLNEEIQTLEKIDMVRQSVFKLIEEKRQLLGRIEEVAKLGGIDTMLQDEIQLLNKIEILKQNLINLVRRETIGIVAKKPIILPPRFPAKIGKVEHKKNEHEKNHEEGKRERYLEH